MFEDLRLWLAATGLVIAGLLGVIVKGSKARVQVSGDSVLLRENESRLDWIAQLEMRAKEESTLRVAAEKRERETHALYMATKVELDSLMNKLVRMEKRLDLITDLLLVERPDLADAIGLSRSSTLAPL